MIRMAVLASCFLCFMSQWAVAENSAHYFKTVSTINSQKVLSKHATDVNFQLLDVRTPSEFQSAHLSGAKQIDFYSQSFDKELLKLDKTKVYMLYCRTGVRSAKTLDKMKQLGFSKVYNMHGGIVDWKRQGFPVVTQ